MSGFLGVFKKKETVCRWEDVEWSWDVLRNRNAVYTKENWPEGDFICNSDGLRVICQGGEARLLELGESSKFHGTTGWILLEGPDIQERRANAVAEAIRRAKDEAEAFNAALRAKADLGHEYRIVITLKDIRDMDHAWDVMRCLSLDDRHIERTVVEMAERRQYPPEQDEDHGGA